MTKTPPERLLIGAHTSAAGGVHKALLHGQRIGATTIQLFTSNQRQWKGRPIPEEELARWKEALESTGIREIMSHDSYLINLGSPSEELLTKSHETFKHEIERCHALDITYLNFHPGAATSGSEEECLNQIVKSLRSFEELCSKGPTRLLLEATAGQGTTVGHRFEHLGFIISELQGAVPIGVCIDTCHIFAAGYDLRTKEACAATIQAFEETVGLEHLYAFHMNDSLKPFASRRDRHAQLGEGEIGIEAFKFLMSDSRVCDLPKYLETPDPSKWSDEIQMLREFAK
jgi:deoxyribonuclease-4